MKFFQWTPFREKKRPAPALPQTAEPAHKRQFANDRKAEPSGLAALVESIESDYQFKFARLVIEALILSVDVQIVVPEGADARAVALAKNLQQRWAEYLPNALRCFAYGRAAFEKSYEPTPGLTLLSGLDYLPFHLSELSLDESGNFTGIILKGKDKEPIPLPPESSLWVALDPTVTEPYGRSRYLGAAKAVFDKRQRLDKNEQIWDGRHAIGQGKARVPDPTPGEAEQQGTKPADVMAASIQEMESGGYLILSNQQTTNAAGDPTGAYEYDITFSEGLKDGTPLIQRRQQLDDAVLRSLGSPERATTQNSDVGTNAMAESHQLVLYATCDGVLSQIINAFQKWVIDKLEVINWPDQRPGIKVVWTGLRQRAEEEAKAKASAPAPSPSPFGFSQRQLATDAPPAQLSDPEAMAARAAREAAAIWAGIKAAAADPDKIDWRRL